MADGLVKLELSSLAGEEMVLTTVKPPQTFGELALLDGGPRSANAEAVQDSRLICIPRRDILALISRQPQLADSLFRSLGGMLRRLTDQAADQVFLDLPGRVAKLLLALAGDSATGGAEIDVPLTQTDLAQMVGGSRQRVNRILASFEARGLLEVHGRRMVIKRPDQLRERAES
jgi:CRP-like cAMP-binding protein